MPGKLIYLLYRAALVLGLPLLLLYVVYRSVRSPGWAATLPERLGFLPPSYRQTAPGAIWLHAVSVGEVMSAAGLVARLKSAIAGAPVFVSVSTLAGHEIAVQRLAGVADGVLYAPFDFAWVVRRVLRRLRPALVIVMETEIWPNLWRESRRSGASLLVVNGRISDRAYPRYLGWRWFFEPVLAHAGAILAQTEISRSRYAALGAADIAATGGNLKYDVDTSRTAVPAAVAGFLARTAPAPVWIAASTMPPAHVGDPDEDEFVLDTFESLRAALPDLVLILVPRRPERFESAAAALTRRGIPFVRRSRLPAETAVRVLLLDSMGELAGVFAAGDVIFMGGTFPHRGGHNILEPAFLSKAIICGPHMENFPEIAADFAHARAFVQVSTREELEAALRRLLQDPAARAELGARARAQAAAKTGATAVAVDAARRLYESALPRPVHTRAAWCLLAPLTLLWRAGAALKRSRQMAARRRLPAPVISIGGIGAGGAGKTPMAIAVARLLRDNGIAPAFLTRGYRRVSPEPCTVLAAGERLPIAATGDEAQLIIRSAIGPVGIGADRFRAGQVLAGRFAPDAFVLDDGFQHWRLHRDADIVLIDTIDPFAGHAVFPLGRLREPLPALARADAFVLTRAQPGRAYSALIETLRRYNRTAPVFRCRVVPCGWVDLADGRPVDAEPGPAVAFCGLGNPVSFWRTLERMGNAPLARIRFPDHHRYHGRDLRRLADDARALGASALWTTEKDAMNLPENWTNLELGCRLLALRVDIALEEPEQFRSWIMDRISSTGRR